MSLRNERMTLDMVGRLLDAAERSLDRLTTSRDVATTTLAAVDASLEPASMPVDHEAKEVGPLDGCASWVPRPAEMDTSPRSAPARARRRARGAL
jgi:hypothetical protein